mgnify:CR=1 FL=1
MVSNEVKERLINLGYDYGFECPQLGSDDEYPEYLVEAADECIQKIKKYQNNGNITFAFMTDIHYFPLPHHEVLLKRNLNVYKSISEQVRCDKLILGGDYVIDSPKTQKLGGYQKLREAFLPFHYLPVNGNHDTGSLWDSFMGFETPVNKLRRTEVFHAFFDHLPEEGAVFNKNHKGLYYYVDDDGNKVRYVMLDICDNPEKYEGTLLGTLCISQSQLDWLSSEALITNYDIVIVAHSILSPLLIDEEKKSLSRYLEVITRVLDAYRNGEAIREDLYEGDFALHVDVNFAECDRGDILGVFVGHYHDDKVEYTKSGIPCIFTANFTMAECKIPRKVGEKSELLFDMVTIDRKTHTLYLTRVGAGEDRVVKYY